MSDAFDWYIATRPPVLSGEDPRREISADGAKRIAEAVGEAEYTPLQGSAPGDGEATELLAELLHTMGLTAAQAELPADEKRRATKRRYALVGIDDDSHRYARERTRVLPVLRRAVAALRDLRCAMPMPTPPEYRTRWQAIVDDWNGALYDSGALDLPPLCEVCGRPCLMKRNETQGERVELSTTCNDKSCRRKAKERRRHR